jgi:hypothetical protein
MVRMGAAPLLQVSYSTAELPQFTGDTN